MQERKHQNDYDNGNQQRIEKGIGKHIELFIENIYK